MSRQIIWLLGAAIGVTAVVASAFMLLAAIAVALLVVPLARNSGGLAAVSGLLTGFGVLWLVLVAGEAMSGGELGNSTLWVAVGGVSLVAGLASLAWILIGASPRRHTSS